MRVLEKERMKWADIRRRGEDKRIRFFDGET
jgi:hypothetical protein